MQCSAERELGMVDGKWLWWVWREGKGRKGKGKGRGREARYWLKVTTARHRSRLMWLGGGAPPPSRLREDGLKDRLLPISSINWILSFVLLFPIRDSLLFVMQGPRKIHPVKLVNIEVWTSVALRIYTCLKRAVYRSHDKEGIVRRTCTSRYFPLVRRC